MKLPIYLDYHATTPVDPRVVAKMLPCFSETFGNAASKTHSFGWQAEALVNIAREQIAGLIGAAPNEIVFTSGATESNNLALKGAAEANTAKGKHLITTAIEHKAVLDTFKKLEKWGFETTVLPVDETGVLDLDRLRDAMRADTIVVSVMHANNEIGTIQEMDAIGRLCLERDILFHTDAAQSAGKIPLDVQAARVDLVSISAHKMYGPKGMGVLYARRRDRRVKLIEQINGGGHERGLRSGTLNVPGIVGMGEAARIAKAEMAEEAARIGAMRDRMLAALLREFPDAQLNGHPTRRLPGNLNISFAGVEAENVMLSLGEIAMSSGSACTSATQEPSHVLRAIGLSEEQANSSIRFGLGRFTTDEEVDYAIGKVIETVGRMSARRV